MMKKQLIRLLAISAAAVMVSLSACERSAEKKDIEAVIRRYNEALMTAFEAMDFEPLRNVATEKEYQRVMVYIQSYAAQGDRLNARLVQLSVLTVAVRGNTALVRTSEKWEYQRVRADSGLPETGKTGYEYDLQYSVMRPDNSWMVDTLTIQGERQYPLTGTES